MAVDRQGFAVSCVYMSPATLPHPQLAGTVAPSGPKTSPTWMLASCRPPTVASGSHHLYGPRGRAVVAEGEMRQTDWLRWLFTWCAGL